MLIAPGTYEEAVDVETEDLTIRGLDRNEVILDGGFELENGIRVLADGVAVENMTARNYTTNGFFWTGVTGYRGLVPHRVPQRRLRRLRLRRRRRASSSTSTPPAARTPACTSASATRATRSSTTSCREYNGLGYSGTNSGGNLLIVNSTFRYNRAGIVPNSGSYELCYPGRDNTIVGNIVHDNMQPDTPAIDVAILADGQRHPRRGQQPQRHRAQPRLRPRAASASASCPSPRRRPTTASPIRTRGTRPARRCAMTRPPSPTPMR